MSDWIISHLPEHDCYVEPFVGSAAVLLNKPESRIEVINDVNGDIVQFFQTLRDRPDELKEWVRQTPYSRELYDTYADEYYGGKRRDDDVERAGRFFYLRCTQFSGRIDSKAGMSFSAVPEFNPARRKANKVDSLEEFAERFRNVQIEHGDYADVVDRYDRDRTLFYFDPPYVAEGDDLYTHGQFDHARFVDLIQSIEGRVAVSYMDLPPGLSDWFVAERDTPQSMNRGEEDRREVATERLVMNYDPDETPRISTANQATLADVGGE